MPHAAIPFRPHHRFAVPLPRSRRGGFSFTAYQLLSPIHRTRTAAKSRRSEPIGALMPHAAFWVVQPKVLPDLQGGRKVSMPHVAIPFRPHHRFAVPLPRSRRGGLVTRRFLAESRNISFPRRCGGAVNVCQSHFVLLVFLGRFPIRPVSRSAVPYGLASRTGQ